MGTAVSVMPQPVRAFVMTKQQREWEVWPMDATFRRRFDAPVRSVRPASRPAQDARLERLDRAAQAVAAARVLVIGLVGMVAVAAGGWIGALR